MKRVITYGTFDLLHYGHINLLRRAKALGDYLIVALSTDEFNLKQKNKVCYFSYEERKKLLEAIRYVDLVIPEESWEQKRTDIPLYHVDTFVMGDDWKGKFWRISARWAICPAPPKFPPPKSRRNWDGKENGQSDCSGLQCRGVSCAPGSFCPFSGLWSDAANPQR